MCGARERWATYILQQRCSWHSLFFRFMMTYSAIAGLVQILGPFHSQSFFRAFEILSAAMDGLARRAGAIQPMSQTIP